MDPQDFDNIGATRGQAQSTATDIVADLDRAMEWAAIGTALQLRTRARIAVLRQFLAEIAEATDAGVGIDWTDAITLPRLEAAMEAELSLRAELARWVRERGGR